MTRHESSIERELSKQREMLARIDERTQHLQTEVAEIRRQMVTRPEFSPVRAIAYGLVGLLLTGIVVAVLDKVLPAFGGG